MTNGDEIQDSTMDEIDNDLKSYGVFVKTAPEGDHQTTDDSTAEVLSDVNVAPHSNDDLNKDEEYLLNDPEVDNYSLESDLEDFDLDTFEEDIAPSLEDGGGMIESGIEDDTLIEPALSAEPDTAMEVELDMPEDSDMVMDIAEPAEPDTAMEVELDMPEDSDMVMDIAEPAESDTAMEVELDMPEDSDMVMDIAEPAESDTAMEVELDMPENADSLALASGSSLDLDDDDLDLSLDQFEPQKESLSSFDDAPNLSLADSNVAEPDIDIAIEDVGATTQDESDILSEANLDDIMSSGNSESEDEILSSMSLGDSEMDIDSMVEDEINIDDDVLNDDMVSMDESPDTAYSEELSELHAVPPIGNDSLKGIEQELSEIKSELTVLREELGLLKKAGKNDPHLSSDDREDDQNDQMLDSLDDSMEIESGIELSQENDYDDLGSPSEVNVDDAVALTDDELDSILTTADHVDEDVERDNKVGADMSTDSFDSSKVDDLLDLDMETALSGIEDLTDDDSDSNQHYDAVDSDSPESSNASNIPEKIELAENEDNMASDFSSEADALDTMNTNSSAMELKQELKGILQYMDSLLENLPEEKIEEFAKSEHFSTYQKLFEELGL